VLVALAGLLEAVQDLAVRLAQIYLLLGDHEFLYVVGELLAEVRGALLGPARMRCLTPSRR
jgi:hypothetical protein